MKQFNYKRVVVKVGSAVLTQKSKLALQGLSNLVEFLSQLKKQYEVILVSSGAVAAGYTLCKLDKDSLKNKQALASLGQPLLMKAYKKEFKKYDIKIAQLLLCDDDFDSKRRLGHAKDVINILLKNGIIPIINENDIIATEELVGDNDQLSALVTHNFDADILAILTDIDGYYDNNPKTDKNAKMIKNISFIDKKDLNKPQSASSLFATGGIVTKLKAADYLLKNNIPMYLSSGFDLHFAKEFLINHNHIGGTLFKN